MAILDTSIVNVAIPTMENDLNTTTAQIQWVLTAYMLTLGVLIPISGWLTDRFGSRQLFLFSLAIFTIGSALCGMSWNLSSILFFRIIQGVGGAFMQPVAMSMIYRIFPPERRGTIMGIFGIAMMVAPAIGPVLSGYFVDYASWRLIFYINVPIGIAAVLLGYFSLYDFPHEQKGKLDIWGLVFSTIGFFSLLYGFNEVSSDGWKSSTVVLSLMIGIVFLVLFIITELKVENPMLNLSVLNNYMFSMSLVISSIIFTAMFVGIFLLPLYLQDIMGYTAVRTGLFMTPAALATAVMMPISGKLFDKIGARPLGLIGLLVITLSTYGFTTLGLQTSSAHIQWLYIIRSIGMGMTMMPIMTAGMNTVPIKLVSQGTAMTNTVRQVSSSLGTAILTSYMTTQATLHTTQLAWMVSPTTYQGQSLLKMQNMFESQGMTAVQALNAARELMYGLISNQGYVQGMNDTFFVSTILCAIAWVGIWFYASKKERAIREGRRRPQKTKKQSETLLLGPGKP
ncbi:putative MFS-type transporter YhcA [Alicyclobacillus fastidiosus]|nr:putative MFS-type transporter YhcA [Alicyclobacillus fastidiosus]GMA64334.1 putative MFS-type transporter YhcA [Alicyclobacillus fastidiosus]